MLETSLSFPPSPERRSGSTSWTPKPSESFDPRRAPAEPGDTQPSRVDADEFDGAAVDLLAAGIEAREPQRTRLRSDLVSRPLPSERRILSPDLDARQLFERVVISRHRPFDEIPLHRISSWHDPVGRAPSNTEPDGACLVPELSRRALTSSVRDEEQRGTSLL
jgi:hypothetical protein